MLRGTTALQQSPCWFAPAIHCGYALSIYVSDYQLQLAERMCFHTLTCLAQ
jgi:hypothetical protein